MNAKSQVSPCDMPVLCWTVDRGEVAAELQVDLPMLAIRERHLKQSEKRYLGRRVRRMGATA